MPMMTQDDRPCKVGLETKTLADFRGLRAAFREETTMRRRLTSGFPIVVMAVCALAAPAWAGCATSALDHTPMCRELLPVPAAWLCRPNEIMLTGRCYRMDRPGSAAIDFGAAQAANTLPPLPSYQPVWQETRPGIESHFDALFAAEAQSHWWKP